MLSRTVGSPKQQRSRESLERLLGAGLEIIESEGLDGFTIATVARRAEVGATLVYRRFKDKDELLGAVFERFVNQRRADLTPAVRRLAESDVGLGPLVAGLVELHAEVFRQNPVAMRAFDIAYRESPALAERVELVIMPIVEETERALLTRRSEFNCRNPDVAVAFCVQTILNSFAALVTGTNRIHTNLGWETITEELSLMSLAYLRTPPPGA